MCRVGLFAVSAADHPDDRKSSALGPLGHFDNDLTDAARRDDDERVIWPEGEVPQNLFCIARRLFQVQALTQTVRTDDWIVVRQAQLENRVPSNEAAHARGHF